MAVNCTIVLANLDIPVMKPVPRKPRGLKHVVEGKIECEQTMRQVRKGH